MAGSLGIVGDGFGRVVGSHGFVGHGTWSAIGSIGGMALVWRGSQHGRLRFLLRDNANISRKIHSDRNVHLGGISRLVLA